MINLGRRCIAREALTMIWHGASRERVARVLWDLAARFSTPGPVRAGVILKAPITKRLIGGATGLPSIHVDRVIRQLHDQQIIEIQKSVIVINNPQILSMIAHVSFSYTEDMICNHLV